MSEKQTTTTEAFIDPICGMQVTPATAAGTFKKDRETYSFCSTGCLQKFIVQAEEKPASCCSDD